MSHYPFVLQQALGIAAPQDTSRRVANPTASTPTEFDNNWDYCENGPSDPQENENVTTFMGPSITHKAGDGREWPENNVYALKTAIEIFRKHGYTFTVPDSYVDMSEEDLSEKDRELDYLKEQYYDNMKICKNNETVFVIARNMGWLVIRCANPEAAPFVESQFSEHFALARVPHTRSTLVEEDGYTITQRTGNKEGSENCSIGTMFELKKYDKVITKCLCSYRNGEMDNVGPTIEQIETAAAWRQHGYGSALMEAIQSHFEDIFEPVMDQKRVKFNVCYVTNFEASRWFQHRGFSDWDGMGEELGKHLGEE